MSNNESSGARKCSPGGSGKTDRQRLWQHARVGAGVLLAVIAVSLGMNLPAVAAQKEAAPVAAAQEVTYPAEQFDNGKARHFQYKTTDGVTIKYFIMKSSDGVIRAAFDACDVCWREGKGYVQEGNVMVCRNCGRKFPSTKINEVTGGCNPAPLTRKIMGGKVAITIGHIVEGKQYFALGGGR